jgi:hypothetical protein
VGGLIGPALGAIGGIKGPFAAFLALVCLSAVAVVLMGRPEQRHVVWLGPQRIAVAGLLARLGGHSLRGDGAAAGSFAPRRMVLNSLWLVVAGIGSPA